MKEQVLSSDLEMCNQLLSEHPPFSVFKKLYEINDEQYLRELPPQ